MPNKNTQEYWEERGRKAIENELKRDKTKAEEIERILNMMIKRIEKEINAFIVKYGDFAGVTLQEAQKIIDEFDVKAFQEEAKRLVENKDFSDRANEELKKYNTKMYVSREQMLKIQIEFLIAYATAQTELSMREYFESTAYRVFSDQAGILGEGVQVAKEVIDTIVDTQFHGVVWSERLWANTEAMKQEVEEIIANVVIRGRHPNGYVKDMRKHLNKFEGTARQKTAAIKSLLYTESARVHAQSSIDSMKEISPEGYYMYIAKIDNRTTKVCKGLNGEIFKVKDAKIGVNFYPMHINCRSDCALLPKSMWPKKPSKKRKTKYFGGKVKSGD
ncbi:TPA: minor capsid protein [Staphylococcus aureus]|uniref:minor capsid protein n=1 Tax=Staphylococcus aureus TaxID=1280 RepID=UPI0013F0F826|nr:minor capsid protein [Staphylococcus aureus]MCC5356379.1 minor capsid protein [Staphylococcus aureus]NGD18215.1 phage head morphogenesis protein [Staphylococcus aureus]HCC5688191.1 minor capsid protein [Staphylococcus aureus]HCX0010465.1 minor capsid protein [Staphylococcus aureus]HCZ9901784.1 minor capsid protein [Staphylococcus aureus]